MKIDYRGNEYSNFDESQILKACPFCGSTKVKYSVKKAQDNIYHAQVYCNDCHATGPRVRFVPEKLNRVTAEDDIYAKNDALDLWNTRDN